MIIISKTTKPPPTKIAGEIVDLKTNKDKIQIIFKINKDTIINTTTPTITVEITVT